MKVSWDYIPTQMSAGSVQARDSQRINNTNNYGGNRRIRVGEHLAGAIALAVDEHRIPHPSLGIVESDEITAGLLTRQGERLHDQQAAMLEGGVAEGGYDRTRDFANDHLAVSGHARLQCEVKFAIGAHL